MKVCKRRGIELLAVFKRELERHLKSVPDQLGCGSYVGLPAASSNTLVDQTLIHYEAWSWTAPQGRLPSEHPPCILQVSLGEEYKTTVVNRKNI